MAEVKNKADFEGAKERIRGIVRKAGRVPLKDLEYPVELHENP